MNSTKKRISPAATHALKEALTAVFWYKSDLRSFLTQCLSDPALLATVNWSDYKRNIVSSLVDYLVRNEKRYQRDLLELITEVSKMKDFSHLRQLEDGELKVSRAKEAVAALEQQLRGHQSLVDERLEIERRRQTAHQKMLRVKAIREKLEEICSEYLSLIASGEPQKRGFRLEKVLRGLFELFDLDPKASFRILGEQIDGAFSFEGTDYLLEAKWQRDPVGAAGIDSLCGKLQRKLDNTLGLYLSINGYSDDAVTAVSSGRRLVILMDGSDLMAVLEGRIDLLQLLLRKRRVAAETGNIYLRIHEILG